MKKNNTQTDSITPCGDQNESEVLSVMDLYGAMYELALPEDIINAMAHCGLLRADMEARPPMFSADDVIELAARLDILRQARDVPDSTTPDELDGPGCEAPSMGNQILKPEQLALQDYSTRQLQQRADDVISELDKLEDLLQMSLKDQHSLRGGGRSRCKRLLVAIGRACMAATGQAANKTGSDQGVANTQKAP